MFTQVNLQPSFMHKFMINYLVNRFIHLKKKLSPYIYDQLSWPTLFSWPTLTFLSSTLDAHLNPLKLQQHLFSGLTKANQLVPNHAQNASPSSHGHWRASLARSNTCVRPVWKKLVYFPKPDSTMVRPPGLKAASCERGTWWMKTCTWWTGVTLGTTFTNIILYNSILY